MFRKSGIRIGIPLASGAEISIRISWWSWRDGKVLVVEYKGAHLAQAQDAQEKREAGEMIEERGEGKVFFLMPSKQGGSPSVRDQIRTKIEEIMAA